MEKSQLHNVFGKPFNNLEWLDVLQNVFGAKQLLSKPRPILLSNNDKAKAAYELGSFTTTDDRVIGLYRIELNPDVWLERNKVGLRELLRNVYKYDVDGAIIVFDQGDKWRLSFVSEIKVLNDEGEVIEQATEPKRYTYLLGQDEKVKTPSERLSKLAGKPLALNDILEAFSVEALNEEFYKIVAEYFYQLIGGKIGKEKKAKDYGNGILQLPSVPKEEKQVYQEFTVRLIGRTVFCWFLKMKKGNGEDSLLPEKLLSSKAVQDNSNYYHTVLERLFFQTLNTRMKHRVDNLPDGCEQIPFLNGGLFEPGTDDYYEANQTTGLSKNLNALIIDDSWFLEFFQELEKYNFTIDENSVTDVEVSVDPEMLGRIFENLLAEIDPDSGETARKATGSFYTPREIVDYMATESLVQYLHNKTDIEPELLRPVFKMTEQDQPKFSSTELESILDALDKVKILDPACGSGAFPMGVLQKIVMVLQKLDSDAAWWKKRQLKRITNPVIKKALREKLDSSSVEYARKIGIIQNSLYGVDIQPIAAEISKLRCFLTLIVDENIDDNKENRGIEPLPNLEFKFVTADTLMKLPEQQAQIGIFDNFEEMELLKELREEYLQSSGKKKEKIKERFIKVQTRLFKNEIHLFSDTKSRAFKLSSWNPFSHDKADWFDPKWMYGVDSFDVVIGNPPYVQMQKDQGVLANRYKSSGYNTFERMGDVYSLFYERGVELLNEFGSLAYITSNKWMRAGYGKSLRNFFSTKTNPKLLIDFGQTMVFKSAIVHSNILLVEKSENTNSTKAVQFQTDLYKDNINITNYFEKYAEIQNQLNHDIWNIMTKNNSNIKNFIEEIGIPLKDTNYKINFGIKTGFNEAYIIDGDKRNELISKDQRLIDFIKPLLRGRDVRKYHFNHPDKWLIFIPWHFPLHEDKTIVGASENAEKLFAKEFPVLFEHFEFYYDKLIKRNTSETGIRYEWYALQRCANTYLAEFEKPKIIYSEIVSSPQFNVDFDGVYPDASVFIITGSNIKYLTALLNSKPVSYFFKTFYAGGELVGKYRYKKAFLQNLPIPIPKEIIKSMFETIVDYIVFIYSLVDSINIHVPNSHLIQLFEEVIDAMVMELYFVEDFKKAGIEFITYAERDFKPIEHLKTEKEKIEVIHQAYQTLRKKDNEIRNNLKLMDIKLADIVMPIKTSK